MTIATRADAARPEETADLLYELHREMWAELSKRTPPFNNEAFDYLVENLNTPESLLAAAMMLAGADACVKTQWHPDLIWKARASFYPANDLDGDGFIGRSKSSMALALIAAIAASRGV